MPQKVDPRLLLERGERADTGATVPETIEQMTTRLNAP